MKVGVMAPQGWKGEYDSWGAAEAWARTVELTREAERLGFESVWVFDHFHTVPVPTDEMTLESFSTITALAMITSRVRLGHMVVCTGFRNPALTAKLASIPWRSRRRCRSSVSAARRIRQRCEEEGRDPSTLLISLHCADDDVRAVGDERAERLGGVRPPGARSDRLLPEPLGPLGGGA